MSAAIEQRNQEATCYVGNLDERVTEDILWELMQQCGPVTNVHMPKDKVSGKHLFYGFVEFRNEEDAEYAMKIMNMVKVYNKPLKMNKAAQDKKALDVGANIFIGNLDPEVDEKLLYDTFSAFGGIVQTPKIMRYNDTGVSKGYGFVSFDAFESSDMAIECMNGQYLSNRAIVVQYAFKKDTPGERHGSQAERLLAAQQPSKFKPNTIFSGGQGD
jgi:splicing factor 3B subunit 4